MTIALSLLSRFWPYLATIALVLGAWAWADHRGYERAETKYQAQIARLEADVREKTAEAELAAVANARNQEAAAAKINQEVSGVYQARIADLRARYDRLRASTAQGRPVATGVSGVPDAPGGSDAVACEAGFSAEDALIASVQAEQLIGLQDWIKAQAQNAGGKE